MIDGGASSLLSDLSFTRADIEQTIPTRFAEVAERLPDQPALTGSGRRWTYRELDRQTNRIAHAILERTSAGRGCVAYLLDHSPEMVVATLAVLKAGKTYLALHPAVPDAAQQAILRDVVPQLVVTSSAYERRVRELTAGICEVLAVETIDPCTPDGPLRSAEQPEDPSTLFYTSGTTGRPKGVVKSHRAVLHRVWLSAEHDRVAPADRQSLLTHCSFSASESDMFGALLQGATLCTFDIASLGLAAFRAWLEDERITLLHPPVLLFRRFLATLSGTERFPDVRVVALAGDIVRPADLERWRRHCSPASVVLHRFSITETAMLTVARLDANATVGVDIVEAGLPVADKELLLVDDAGQVVANGEIGELTVRSAYLSDGYWGRPDETAVAFTIDPHVPRLTTYRTGDLGRFRPDGTFVFLGRRDHQLKIRGYRVETRETESALLELRSITEAAVIADQSQGEVRLVAFVVQRAGMPFDEAVLRAELSARLPEWKMPARLYPLPSLPITLTGKVDRQQLADDARLRVDSAACPASLAGPVSFASLASSVDPVERDVAAVYAQLLKLPAVGRSGNFFDLGGNSLLLLELQVALERAFGLNVAIQELVHDPTVAGVAAILRQARSAPPATNAPSPSELPLVPLRTAGTSRALFLVHGALGRATTNRHFLDALGDDQRVYGFQARGFADADDPHARISDMAAEYVALMRSVQPEGPYWLGAICAGGMIALEMAVQLRAVGQQVGPILMIDPWLPPREQDLLRFITKRGFLAAATVLIRHRGLRGILVRYINAGDATERQMNVWLRFRIAAYRHQLSPYDGPVHVVGSRPGLGFFHDGRWARYLTGKVQLLEAGREHRDVFAISNEQSVRFLRQYADNCREWFAHGAPVTAGATVENRPTTS